MSASLSPALVSAGQVWHLSSFTCDDSIQTPNSEATDVTGSLWFTGFVETLDLFSAFIRLSFLEEADNTQAEIMKFLVSLMQAPEIPPEMIHLFWCVCPQP